MKKILKVTSNYVEDEHVCRKNWQRKLFLFWVHFWESLETVCIFISWKDNSIFSETWLKLNFPHIFLFHFFHKLIKCYVNFLRVSWKLPTKFLELFFFSKEQLMFEKTISTKNLHNRGLKIVIKLQTSNVYKFLDSFLK